MIDLVFSVGITVVFESVTPSGSSGELGEAEDVGVGEALGLGAADAVGVGDALGCADALGLGAAEALGDGDALGRGVAAAEGAGVGIGAGVEAPDEIFIFDLTGVVAIVTNFAVAIFLTGAGVAGELLLAGVEFEFLFQIAVQTILLVPTVTETFSPLVTELQLQPPNE